MSIQTTSDRAIGGGGQEMSGQLIRSKTARNINQGDLVLGLELTDCAMVFVLFLICEACFGLIPALITGGVNYVLMTVLRQCCASGSLSHCGRWLAEQNIFPAFRGLDENGAA